MTLYREPRQYPQTVMRGTQPKRRGNGWFGDAVLVLILMAAGFFLAWCLWVRP